MTQSEINQAAKNAKLNCSSFVDCFWDESNKCIVYTFKNAVAAGSFQAQRKIQGSLNRMEIEIFHGNLTALREHTA
jgi:hypothetical protein